MIADARRPGPLYCVGSGGLSYALASALAPDRPSPADRPSPRDRLSPADRPSPCDGLSPADAPSPRDRLAPAGLVSPDAGGVVLGAAAPVLVVSGSRSPVTARQIDAAERAGWAVLDAGGPDAIAHAEASLRQGRHTIVQTTRGPSRDPAGVGELLGRVAAAAVRAGLARRLVVAGGDTSGQVVSALGARALDVVGTLAVGGPVCVLASDDPACDGLQVALKGGQVGGEDFFLSAASGIGPAR